MVLHALKAREDQIISAAETSFALEFPYTVFEPAALLVIREYTNPAI